jgi:hypothetical protein
MRGVWVGSAVTLAALRVALTGAILLSNELWHAQRWAALPPELRFPPEGLHWFVHNVPIGPKLAQLAQLVVVLAGIAALLGVAARTAMAVLTLSGLYVFAVAQLSGSVVHDMHVFWFTALLAVSPSGDALSIEPWLRKRAGPQPSASVAYGVPRQFVCVLLGVIYFFPGYWKLATSGHAWLSGEILRNHLYWKWYEAGVSSPRYRIDQVPGLLAACALAVVLFELGFIAAVWSRRGRLLAAAAGLCFHIATQLFMRVTFVSLVACYVVLVDWDVVFRPRANRGSAPSSAGAVGRWQVWPAALLGSALVLVNVVQGARAATEAWPFACYPTFDRNPSSSIADLRIEAVRADGSTRAIPDGPSTGGRARSSNDWSMAWRVAGLYGQRMDMAQLRAYWQQLRRDPRAADAARDAVALRFYAATYSALPERRTEQPVRKYFIAELRPF